MNRTAEPIVASIVGHWWLAPLALALWLPMTTRSEATPNLTSKQAEYFQEILKASGASQAQISSSDRTVEKQVTVMLSNCEANSAGGKCTKDKLAPGYKAECSGPMVSAFSENGSREENIKKMSAALQSALPKLGDNRPCMIHVVVPGQKTKNVAIDVMPSTVPDHRAFYKAVRGSCADQERFFYPTIGGVPQSKVPERAFHIEFRLDDTCANTAQK